MSKATNLFIRIVCIVFINTTISAQNYSGLQNKKLAPANDLSSLLSTGIGSLFGGKIEGKIDSVIVVEDSERTLKCKIYYTGFENGFFSISSLGEGQKQQSEINGFKFSQPTNKSPVECNLTLKENVKEGTQLESLQLRIEVGKKLNGVNFSTAYILPKKWSKAIAPQNLIQTAQLIPIGNAASLTEQKTDKLPPKVIKIDYRLLNNKKLIVKPVASTKLTNTRISPTPGTTPATPVNTPKNTGTITPVYYTQIGKSINLSQKPVLVPVATGGSATVDKKAKGADELSPLNLIDEILVDPSIDFNFRDITSISTWSLFPDKNPKSGVYYFIPENFRLKWSNKNPPEKGYDISITYGTQRDQNAAANVRMASTLTSGISKGDIDFIKRLLKAADPEFKDLKMLPMAAPEFTFQSELGNQYSIGSDKISVQSFSDITSDMQVSWQTDADTKEFMQTSLINHDGIIASVVLKPKGNNVSPITIPAVINIGDPRILGKVLLTAKSWRNGTWRNTFPYPVRLNNLHIIRKELNGTRPVVYSWSLGGIEAPSLSQIKFANSKIIPSWVDDPKESPLIWLDYDVLACKECDEKVMDAITGGVSSSRVQQIRFTIPPVLFEQANVSYFIVNLKSIQADPNGKVVTEITPIRISASEVGEFTSVGPLYLKTDGSLEYEYKLTAATTDGDFVVMDNWVSGNEIDVLIGRSKLKEIFGNKLPGLE